MFLSDLNPAQCQHLVRTETLWADWKAATQNRDVPGMLMWKPVKGREYLIHSHNGKTAVLGLRSAATEQRMALFTQERHAARQYLDVLTRQMNDQARLNRAAGLGRIPKTAAIILRRFERDGVMYLADHNAALLAYETMARVSIRPRLLTTGHDPATEIGKALHLLPQTANPAPLHDALRSVDRSFSQHDGGTRAVNAGAYAVHLSTPSDEPGLWLDRAPAVNVLCIGEDGLPVQIPAPDPRLFLLRAAWLARHADTSASRACHAGNVEQVRGLLHTKLRAIASTAAIPLPAAAQELALQFGLAA